MLRGRGSAVGDWESKLRKSFSGRLVKGINPILMDFHTRHGEIVRLSRNPKTYRGKV